MRLAKQAQFFFGQLQRVGLSKLPVENPSTVIGDPQLLGYQIRPNLSVRSRFVGVQTHVGGIAARNIHRMSIPLRL